jgi:hypothetical protein
VVARRLEWALNVCAYACMCICMYVHMHVCAYACMCICMYVMPMLRIKYGIEICSLMMISELRTHIDCVCECTCMYVCLYVCTYVCICAYVVGKARTYVCMRMHMHVYVCMCM